MSKEKLFSEFTPASYEEWRAAAEKLLKGAPFEKKLLTKTYEGLTLQPIYFQEDVENLSHHYTLPGEFPGVRGNRSDGYQQQPWWIAQEITDGSPRAFNKALQHDLTRGQTAVYLLPDVMTRSGLDPDQTEASIAGQGGTSISILDDLVTALEGVDLAQTPVFIHAGVTGLPLLGFLLALAKKQGYSADLLKGCLESDPLAMLAHSGSLPFSLDKILDSLASLTAYAADNLPEMDTIMVHAYPYHESGGHSVHELAFMMATAVFYLREMQQRGLDIETTARKMQFAFAVDSQFFMSVAKLRAARMLWSQIVAAFGGSTEAQQMKLHVRTSRRNKTTLDPYVNMLRTTVETFAGATGGADSIHTGPFDEILRQPDAFSRRVARNQQIILQQECHLTQLIDPAGGSWYVESVTDWLARQAWELFQEVEAKGGMLAALQEGWPQKQVKATTEARTADLESRKAVRVGVNMYANRTETPLERTGHEQQKALHTERLQTLQTHRESLDTDTLKARLQNISQAEDQVTATVEAVLAGASLNQVIRELCQEGAEPPSVPPLHFWREAHIFEDLRQAARDYEAAQGNPPRIFLATMGPVARHKARADFTTGFYESGGFEVINSGTGFDSAEAAAQAVLESGAGAVVICSTDDTYPDIVPALAPLIKDKQPEMAVILAGYPENKIADYQAAGVDDFIHIRANCYALNRKLQQQMGVLNV